MQFKGPSMAAAPGKVAAPAWESSSQSVPGVIAEEAGVISPKWSPSLSVMQAVGRVSLGAAPGNVLPSAGSQSPPPRIFGLSPCVSAHPVQATYRSPSGSLSSGGTAPEHALSLPSHTSGAPG